MGTRPCDNTAGDSLARCDTTVDGFKASAKTLVPSRRAAAKNGCFFQSEEGNH